jgi:maleylacetoacetate isomerase
MKLYDYWRSSAAFRVRIALNLKGLSYEQVSVHLVKEGGQQHSADYKSINPQAFVPCLVTDKGESITQSLAIIEYLEETVPAPALLPEGALQRARVRSLADIVACDIHPLNNLRVLQYLVGDLNVASEDKNQWYNHWIYKGFDALEIRLAQEDATGNFCHGDTPTLADICLVPQVYNALRFNCDMVSYPNISRINDNCLKHSAFEKALPENQPDAV